MGKLLVDSLEYIGGVTLLLWRIIKLIFRGRVYGELLLQQMVLLGVNSIPIAIVVMAFIGSVFTYMLAGELSKHGAANMTGGLLLLIMLREAIPMFTTIVLAGKVGASITSEIGTMKISEQLDALRALSTDPDWYLTLPRTLAAVLMMPVVAVFGGYSAWFAGYITAKQQTGMSYTLFTGQVRLLVDEKDYVMCLIKCVVFSAMLVLTACYYGFQARGGASGVGKVVTTSVVVNIFLLFVIDLILTMIMTG
ncbi:ABC transporter permease [bacterium]|nr:ABC transporter permease [bacterium]